MTLLPANIANYGALERNLKSYPYNNPVTAPTDIVKTSRSGAEGRKGHHISQIAVDRPDGARYVYGEQVYNFKQIEATFNTEGAVDVLNGFVGYNPNVDNTMDNSDGIDHYFSSTELPPYATAYQLTAVLSADYVDLTGDGPTLDDLGTYTKFNYTTIYNMDSPYKWRNPYNANIANFSEGYKVKDRDNKGNYLYGEKEIKMLQLH